MNAAIPERYQRHSLLDWFNQATVSRSSVVVIGAGAIGNEVLKNICLLGVGRIHIVDFDRIEEHNLTRTVLFKPADVGKLKCEAAALACQQIDPNAKITFAAADCWNSLVLGELKGYDGVLCCVDNLEARIRLNRLCKIAQVDLFNAAIDSRSISVEMYPFRTSPDCACYECWLPPSAYSTMRKRYSCGWLKRVSFQEKKVPTTAITSSLAGASMVSLFLQRKCDHPQRHQGATKYLLDSVTLASSVCSISQFTECPGCSSIQADCYIFSTKRQSAGATLGEIVTNNDFTILLSEPLILDGKCNACGYSIDVFDLACKYDETLADCPTCEQRSVSLRISDSLSCRELTAAFRTRPLPVKFLCFNNHEQQFVLELED